MSTQVDWEYTSSNHSSDLVDICVVSIAGKPSCTLHSYAYRHMVHTDHSIKVGERRFVADFHLSHIRIISRLCLIRFLLKLPILPFEPEFRPECHRCSESTEDELEDECGSIYWFFLWPEEIWADHVPLFISFFRSSSNSSIDPLYVRRY